MKKKSAGFTMMEASVSAGIFAIALYGSSLAIGKARDTTTRSVAQGAVLTKKSRVAEKIEDLFQRVSGSTLEWSPQGGFFQPMVKGDVSDNIGFRKLLGYSDKTALYDPPLDQAPHKIYLKWDYFREYQTDPYKDSTADGTRDLTQDGTQDLTQDGTRDLTQDPTGSGISTDKIMLADLVLEMDGRVEIIATHVAGAMFQHAGTSLEIYFKTAEIDRDGVVHSHAHHRTVILRTP